MQLVIAITNMPGPQFLLLYAVVIVVTLVVSKRLINRMDETTELPLLRIPERPSPLTLAYLRGGENEVTRLTIFALMKRGYLQIADAGSLLSKHQQVEQASDHPDVRHLSGLERTVFEFFSTPRKASEIFQELPDSVEAYCTNTRQRLEDQNLLHPGGKTFVWPVALAGAIIIVGLGGIKLEAALLKGRSNIQFLITLGIIAVFLLCVICTRPRLTNLGQRFLEQLQSVFSDLKQPTETTPINVMLLGMGIFGVTSLASTQYESFGTLFTTSSSSAGCGGGCGGGGGGGGGGGCGGCGGG